MSSFHIQIPDTPYKIDASRSDREYLYIELEQGVSIVIKATDEGVVIDAYTAAQAGEPVCEPVATTWAT